MELESLILSEVSQKEKDKYHMIPLISGIYYMAQINPFTKRKSWIWRTDLWLPREEGEGWTGNLGLIDVNYCLWNG